MQITLGLYVVTVLAKVVIICIVGKSVYLLFLLGCQYGNPSRIMGNISPVFFSFFPYFFSMWVKVLPVTPQLSAAFVHRVFAYFVRFEGAAVMRIFLWCTQEKI